MKFGVLFDQFPRLVVRPALGDHDLHHQVLIAAAGAHAGQADPRAARRAGRDLHGHTLAADCRHFHFAAQNRLGNADRHIDQDVFSFASEVGVRVDADLDDDVLARLPLPRDPQFLAVFEAGRDLDVDLAVADAEADRAAERRGQERNASLDLNGLGRRLRSADRPRVRPRPIEPNRSSNPPPPPPPPPNMRRNISWAISGSICCPPLPPY